MGWTSYASTKQQLISDLTIQSRLGERFSLVKYSLVGNNLWILMLEKSTGLHFIHLDKLAYFRQDDAWGYKPIGEECGPHESNCPLSFLDYPAKPEGYAIDFRERVKKYHADKKSKPKAFAGMVLSYASHQFKLIESLGRKGWRVEHLNGGLYNRLTAKQLSAALRKM